MENASKALLIAGSVLIVLLLIGIGMLIYSRATGVIDTAASTMNSQEIQAFNSQFTPYEGNQKGASIRSLISKVIANNATYKDSENRQVYIIYGEETKEATNLSKISAAMNTGKTYKVTFTEYNNGLIKKITIE